MCGIFSIANDDGLHHPIEAYKNALKSLAHRGPDDEGVFNDERVFLGHRRLSIIDPSPAGHQPMANAEESVIVVFNGQIYNFKELRKNLELKGHRFHTKCDTEVLLNAYIDKGTACFNDFIGMWAVVIYDKRTNVIITSRDRMGIKPLFCYRSLKGDLVFASEIKAILACYPEAAEENPLSVYRFIARGWLDFGEETMFRNITQLPRAAYSVWSLTKPRETVKFWDFPTPTNELVDPDQLREVFSKAVSDHMVSDVPIASTLSGGIDSTSINCTIVKTLGRGDEIHAFSVVPPNSPDESKWIDDTVDYLGLSHEYLYPDEVDESSSLDKLIDNMDEPIFGVPFLYQSLLREKIGEKGYKVLLIGDGGDEIFGGYQKVHPIFVLSQLGDGEYGKARKAIKGGAVFAGRDTPDQIEGLKKLRDFGIGKRTVQEFKRGYDLMHGDAIYSEAEAFPESNYPQLEDIDIGKPFFQELLDRFHLDNPYHLRIEDRIAMQYGIEARPVFLDHRVIECAWSYNYGLFMKGGIGKHLMREALDGILTPSVRENNQKFGRPGNDSVLVYDKVTDELRDTLSSRKLKESGMWSENIAGLFEEDLANKNFHSAFPWFRFLILQKWFKAKINKSASPTVPNTPSPAYG